MTEIEWYDAEHVRLNIQPGDVFIVQELSIAGKTVELVGPLRLRHGDRIHLRLASDEQKASTPFDETLASPTAPDNECR